MPVLLVPLHESNQCHNPAGPGGGQFCSTEDAAFRAWFGKSKVVDAAGRPLVMYHGTDRGSPIEAFSRQGSGARGAELGRGIYVTNALAYAEKFGSVVMPLYVRAERIAEPRDYVSKNIHGEDLRRWAIKNGYDAVRSYKGEFGGVNAFQLIVFEPDQVKSARGKP